jgi:CheY-like chemotaxis protein/anti-sigma regulatory factor (Ser/Thr protein kinase)
MDLAKIEAGKMDVHIENVEVPRLVAEVLALTQPLVEKNGNKLASSIDPNAVVVRADAKRLRQGLLNLISNAAKFTQHGIVRLDVKHAGESITFDVSDTGIGMTPAQMARLFQPFMQAEDTTSRKYGGTGLGLTNTKHFCELMGGSVSLESKPGVGSTFTIRLPATSRAPSSGRPAEARGHASEERPVLVIDDDPAVVELISSTLKEEGFRVVSALNGEEGLKLARQVEPLAITLDVVNSGSGMDGFQTLEALRADPATRSIPVIVFTMVESRERALSFGAAESLSKPVHPDQLMAVFRRLGIVSRAYPVLIVEDDTVNRGLLRKMLERTGFRVEEAENGRIALDLLESEQPAVVLLDLMLPEVDGFELLARIRERRDLRDVPVVVITGRDLTDGDRERFSDNVRDVLQKGKYSREELVAHVRELISEQAAARSRARTAASIEPAT